MTGSIGYRSFRPLGSRTLYGFTTAAHVVNSTYPESVYTLNRVLCGNVSTLQYGVTIDAAFHRSQSIAIRQDYRKFLVYLHSRGNVRHDAR